MCKSWFSWGWIGSDGDGLVLGVEREGSRVQELVLGVEKVGSRGCKSLFSGLKEVVLGVDIGFQS